MAHDATTLAGRLSRLVQVRTVTPLDLEPLSDESAAAFAALRALLTELYPTVLATAEVTTVGRAGLLLRVAGSPAGTETGTQLSAASRDPEDRALTSGQTADAGPGSEHSATHPSPLGATSAGVTALGPVLLMAHQDVVPAAADWADAGWTHPPFDGVVEDGPDGLTVYGRGTLDDKGALLTLLEAVEDLLAEGWRPDHDLYLSLGADEESDGASAVAAAAELERRGVVPAIVLDEGGAVTTGVIPTMTRPVAVVGVAEKGIVNLRVTVSADPRKPAHASTPPRRGATAGLARAIAALERVQQPVSLDDVSVRMFADVAPYTHGPLRAVLARADRLRPLLARVLPYLGPEMAAMVRTTMAATMLTGSDAPNVLAARASAVVNMRVATSTTIAAATRHVEKVVSRAVGPGLTSEVTVVEGHEPTPPSPFDARWDAVTAAVAASYPDAVTVGYTMLGASDSRHMARLSPAVYRFSPLQMSGAQRASVHGVDERVTADALLRGVRFYRALLNA